MNIEHVLDFMFVSNEANSNMKSTPSTNRHRHTNYSIRFDEKFHSHVQVTNKTKMNEWKKKKIKKVRAMKIISINRNRWWVWNDDNTTHEVLINVSCCARHSHVHTSAKWRMSMNIENSLVNMSLKIGCQVLAIPHFIFIGVIYEDNRWQEK